jgi:hypothetical protein
MNLFVKKTIVSMTGLDGDQVEGIMKAANAFKSSEIDRKLAMEVFDKVSKKSPDEINNLLKQLKLMV